jgi:hypothetical protein
MDGTTAARGVIYLTTRAARYALMKLNYIASAFYDSRTS